MADSSDQPMFGSYDDTGLDSTTCFSSSARYRPYGYAEEADDGLVKASAPSNIIWEDVKWGDLQKACIIRNRDRYEDMTAVNQSSVFRYAEYSDLMNIDETLYFPKGPKLSKRKRRAKGDPKYKKRTAVVFQMQESREWTLDTTQYVRSMVMELSLHTGGEYEVFVLVEVADDGEPIFNNRGVYHKIIERSVPREFQDISFLFNRKLLKHWYPKVPWKMNEDNSSHAYAPLQLLSLARPDIEFFWLMDVDARYTGHHYDHLEKISAWSKAQSREVLWELASQLYMREVHKSWKNFAAQIKKFARKATIRGPLRTKGIEPIGPQPPMMLSGKDKWGVGEEADFITLGPVFDPAGSSFQARSEVANYPAGVERTPRRATPFSIMTRTSKRLLRAMHHGQVTLGTHMPPSMFPASTALHHGLKVVAFPLPIFLEAAISPEQLEKEFNHPDWGRHTYDVPYKYTDFWRRMTFAITLDEEPTFADELYKRWLGYDATHTRGLCLPGLLLHPVQGV